MDRRECPLPAPVRSERTGRPVQGPTMRLSHPERRAVHGGARRGPEEDDPGRSDQVEVGHQPGATGSDTDAAGSRVDPLAGAARIPRKCLTAFVRNTEAGSTPASPSARSRRPPAGPTKATLAGSCRYSSHQTHQHGCPRLYPPVRPGRKRSFNSRAP